MDEDYEYYDESEVYYRQCDVDLMECQSYEYEYE
jgi:hypothetical protein